MIVNLRIFYERSDENFIEYNRLWNDNKNIMVSLHDFLIGSHINIETARILSIKYTNKNFLENKIILNVISGKGITYGSNKVWYPKEIWIYNPNNIKSRL